MGLFKNFNFEKLKNGLSKTRDKIVNKITEVVTGKAKIDSATIEEIEEILISSDIGYDTAMKVIEEVRGKMRKDTDRTGENVIQTVKRVLVESLRQSGSSKDYSPDFDNEKPYVILIVGVNGVGKTTTIGKLAHNFKQAGLSVMVGAADTFRAAANEQLDIWAKRAGVPIISKGHGADPSSVAYETVEKARKEKIDVVLIDTAGRLHNKTHLMDELNKIRRVIGKQSDRAPHDTFLILDGTTGQNALIQSEEFAKVTEVTGLVITKLDGTAKGGVIFQITAKQKIPVRYIGIGEGIDDLQNFDPEQFVDALFEK